jgi:tRNA uridine 5-carbamoylmethylation protein Kti12
MSESTDETLEEPIDGEPVEGINESSDPPPKKEKWVAPMIKVLGFVSTKPISHNDSTTKHVEIQKSRYW